VTDFVCGAAFRRPPPPPPPAAVARRRRPPPPPPPAAAAARRPPPPPPAAAARRRPSAPPPPTCPAAAAVPPAVRRPTPIAATNIVTTAARSHVIDFRPGKRVEYRARTTAAGAQSRSGSISATNLDRYRDAHGGYDVGFGAAALRNVRRRLPQLDARPDPTSRRSCSRLSRLDQWRARLRTPAALVSAHPALAPRYRARCSAIVDQHLIIAQPNPHSTTARSLHAQPHGS
jgi:hypothetical protein